MQHDYDIDLGLFASEIDLARLEALVKNCPPFLCISQENQIVLSDANANANANANAPGPSRTAIPVIYKLRHANGIIADIFLHYADEGRIWHGTALYRWENSRFTLTNYPLAGVTPLGPQHADQQLTENYGNWQVPQTEFHCAYDTPNLVLHASPMSLAMGLRRLVVLQGRSAEQAQILLQQMAAAGFIQPAPRNGPDTGWMIARDLRWG